MSFLLLTLFPFSTFIYTSMHACIHLHTYTTYAFIYCHLSCSLSHCKTQLASIRAQVGHAFNRVDLSFATCQYASLVPLLISHTECNPARKFSLILWIEKAYTHSRLCIHPYAHCLSHVTACMFHTHTVSVMQRLYTVYTKQNCYSNSPE